MSSTRRPNDGPMKRGEKIAGNYQTAKTKLTPEQAFSVWIVDLPLSSQRLHADVCWLPFCLLCLTPSWPATCICQKASIGLVAGKLRKRVGHFRANAPGGQCQAQRRRGSRQVASGHRQVQ